MAKILIAASPEPRAIVERILADHNLMSVETLGRAEQLLNEQTFDLIICTVSFDDSRMLDLLRSAKSIPKAQQTPFICARVRLNILRSPEALKNLVFICQELGAAGFLNIADYTDPEREMRADIEKFLPTAAPLSKPVIRVKFYLMFKANPDGSYSPVRNIKLGHSTIISSDSLFPGQKIGWFDVGDHIGKELDITPYENGTYRINEIIAPKQKSRKSPP